MNIDTIKVGMKLRIKTFTKRPYHWNNDGKMDKYMGKTVTIRSIRGEDIHIFEDIGESIGNGWHWEPTDFELARCIFSNHSKG